MSHDFVWNIPLRQRRDNLRVLSIQHFTRRLVRKETHLLAYARCRVVITIDDAIFIKQPALDCSIVDLRK